MKENRFDAIFKRGVEDLKGTLGYIKREYGDVRPFNTELPKPVDILYTYEKLMLPENQATIQQLITKHGFQAWEGFQKKALLSKKARGL
jgi:hypothetical protein|tara:strand:- start:9 stop:275 length:267 start_codon:yes stop_codon:yes gene_type:complete